MSYTENIPQPGLAHYPISPYRDRLGLAHEGLSHTTALQVRNHNLVTQLTVAKAQLRGEHRPAND